MFNQILNSRLLRSAVLGGDCSEQDFASQYDEFLAIAHDVLHSEMGYLAIEEQLDEALGVIELCLQRKKASPCVAI